MPRKTLQKFQDVHDSPFVVEYSHDDLPKEVKAFIEGDQPVYVELACGHGDFSVELARQNPQAKVLGIDIQGERLWHGAGIANQESLNNLLFVRMDIRTLADVYPKSSIDHIWITFPDPHPKKKHAKRRLTNQRFLNLYQTVLKPHGKIHLKTDAESLYIYSQESADAFGAIITDKLDDIDTQLHNYPLLQIQTHYEKKWRAQHKTIHYLQLELN